MLPYLTIDKFAMLSGYTAGAIRAKVAEGVWVEGDEYIRAPDNRVLVSVGGFEQWVQKQNTRTSQSSLKVASKSRSTTQQSRQDNGSASSLSPRPIT